MSYHAQEIEFTDAECSKPYIPNAGLNIGGRKRTKPSNYHSHISDVVGTFIVNAVSGSVYPWRVGEGASLWLYRVIDATGSDGSRDPHHLYYDSPEEYIRHQGVKLNPDEVAQWYSKKNMIFDADGEFNENAYAHFKATNQ